MSKALIISLLAGYFLILIIIAFLTSGKRNNDTFFVGNRNSKWYLVAFGMIGASLSGVTFISIPGTIRENGFTYLQIALGYIIGYAIIAFVLLPLYYRLNLTSIYTYLKQRFGLYTYKLGAGFFILSRVIGAALRMYLVANVLQQFIFDDWGVSFEITVTISILLIWVYTFRGGMKTIVYTDVFQTLFMLTSLGVSIYLISDDLNLAFGDIYNEISSAGYGTVFQTENPMAGNYWWKGILGGMFICLGMTGVDQDMMQKNLTCKNQREAKINMLSFSVILFIVNVLFVVLGGLLYLYIEANPDVAAIWLEKSLKAEGDGDILFATIALEGTLGYLVGIPFLIGLTAATYASADSALASLTTSFAVDFMNIETKTQKRQEQIRRWSHVLMSAILLVSILLFKLVVADSVIWEIFKAAGYTYGPLLGLFIFGIITKRRVNDVVCCVISLVIPTLLFLFNEVKIMETVRYSLLGEFKFGPELLGVNALLVMLFMFVFSSNHKIVDSNSEIIDNLAAGKA